MDLVLTRRKGKDIPKIWLTSFMDCSKTARGQDDVQECSPSVRPSVRSPKEEGVSDVLHRVLPPFLSIYRVTHKDGKNLVLT